MAADSSHHAPVPQDPNHYVGYYAHRLNVLFGFWSVLSGADEQRSSVQCNKHNWYVCLPRTPATQRCWSFLGSRFLTVYSRCCAGYVNELDYEKDRYRKRVVLIIRERDDTMITTSKSAKIIQHIVLIILTLVCLLPLLLLLMASLTDDQTLMLNGNSFFPVKLSADAYT